MAEFRGWGGAAVVTGATSGIGLEIARGLAGRGMDLVLVARSAENLRIQATKLAETHRVRVLPVSCDLSAPDAAERLPEIFRQVDATVDLLVNSAGFGIYGPFPRDGIEREAELVRLNAIGPTILAGLFLPGMLRRRRGVILNVASTAAFAPVPWLSTYAATKSYLLSWTHALDTELRGTGVRACVLCPGTTATNFLTVAGSADAARRLPQQTPAQVAEECLRGLDRGKRVIVTGLPNRVHRLAAKVFPASVGSALGGLVMRPPKGRRR